MKRNLQTDEVKNSLLVKRKKSQLDGYPQKRAYKQQIKNDEQQDQLDIFLKQLRSNKNLSQQEYLVQVRNQMKSLSKRQQKEFDITQQNYLLEKFCESCGKFNDDQNLLLCDCCDDGYHIYCLNPALIELPEQNQWVCHVCESEMEARNIRRSSIFKTEQMKQTQIEDHFQTQQANHQEQLKLLDKKLCKKCSLQFTTDNFAHEICVKCCAYYHANCFNQKGNSIVCHQCQLKIQSKHNNFNTMILNFSFFHFSKGEIPQNQTSIVNFFKSTYKQQNKEDLSRSSVKKLKLDKSDDIFQQLTQSTRKIRLSSPIVSPQQINKKTRRDTFLLPQISSDSSENLQRKSSLIYALQAKNITFDDDLRFSNSLCPPSMNQTTLEPNLQQISTENNYIFKQFKELTRNGTYAPVIVEEDKTQGFVVRADDDIPDLTLICEYVGEVDFARNHIFDSNDSIMDLLRTSRSSTSLVICPNKFGNIARFLSGINNFSRESKAKQNVASIRYDIEGHARVILYAQQNIKKGELLYYDYNAGGFGEYPTHHFI